MRLIISLFILFTFQFGLSQDIESLFEKANQAYQKENYQEALQTYQQLIDANKQSSELYYNIANAAFQNKEIGKAILYFEKAKLLAPGDQRINHNLNIARNQVDTEIIEIPDFVLVRWWRSMANFLSPIVWICAQLVCLMVILWGMYNWRLVQNVIMRKKGLLAIVVSTCLLILFLLLGRTAHYLEHNTIEGIVMDNAKLKVAPDNRSDDVQSLSEGVKIKVLDAIDDWYKVRLVNKEIGWLPIKDIERI